MKNNNVTFDEFKIKSRSILGQSESPAMIKTLVKSGLVKSENQALMFMVTLIILFVGATVFIVYTNFFKESIVPALTPEQELIYNAQAEAMSKVNQQIQN